MMNIFLSSQIHYDCVQFTTVCNLVASEVYSMRVYSLHAPPKTLDLAIKLWKLYPPTNYFIIIHYSWIPTIKPLNMQIFLLLPNLLTFIFQARVFNTLNNLKGNSALYKFYSEWVTSQILKSYNLMKKIFLAWKNVLARILDLG